MRGVWRRVTVDRGEIRTHTGVTLVQGKISDTRREPASWAECVYIYDRGKLKTPLRRKWPLDGFRGCRLVIVFSQPQPPSFPVCFMTLGLGLCKPHSPLPATSLEKKGLAASCLLPVPVGTEAAKCLPPGSHAGARASSCSQWFRHSEDQFLSAAGEGPAAAS